MLEKLKIYMGIHHCDEKDEILESLIAICSDEFKALTHTDVIVESVVIQMVVYKYNRLGTEGLKKEQYSGYENEFMDAGMTYSPELMQLIKSYRKIRVVN